MKKVLENYNKRLKRNAAHKTFFVSRTALSVSYAENVTLFHLAKNKSTIVIIDSELKKMPEETWRVSQGEEETEIEQFEFF